MHANKHACQYSLSFTQFISHCTVELTMKQYSSVLRVKALKSFHSFERSCSIRRYCNVWNVMLWIKSLIIDLTTAATTTKRKNILLILFSWMNINHPIKKHSKNFGKRFLYWRVFKHMGKKYAPHWPLNKSIPINFVYKHFSITD